MTIMITEMTVRQLVESSDPFPVDFDNAWQWIGWSKKQDGKTVLLNNFDEDLDFLRGGRKSPTGGRPSELILLSVDCFKSLSMMAGTAMGREVRKHFLQCEKDLKALTSPPATQAEMLVVWAQQFVEQERRVASLEAADRETQQRLAIVEAEQDRYESPCGKQMAVLAYSKLLGRQISLKESSALGVKATALCRQQGRTVEKVKDPRFGTVNIYPESVLAEIFGVPLDRSDHLPRP